MILIGFGIVGDISDAVAFVSCGAQYDPAGRRDVDDTDGRRRRTSRSVEPVAESALLGRSEQQCQICGLRVQRRRQSGLRLQPQIRRPRNHSR